MKAFLHKNEFWILLILLLTAVLSAHLPSFEVGGVHLLAFRIVVIALGLVCLPSSFKKLKGTQLILPFTALLGGMFVFALINYLWVDEPASALKHAVFWLLIGLSLSALFGLRTIAGENVERFKSNFLSVLMIAIVASSLLACFEVLSSYHLGGSFVDRLADLKPFHTLNNSAVATFGNPNNLAGFVVLSAALIVLFGGNKSRSWLVIALALSISAITASRISFIVAFGLLMFEITKNLDQRMKFASLLAGILFACSMIYSGLTNMDLNNSSKLKQGDFIEGPILKEDVISIKSINDSMRVISYSQVVDTLEQSSDQSRFQLAKTGLALLRTSNGVGIGVGQFEHEIAKKNTNEGIVNPHSFPLRILVEYGLFGILFWGGFIFILLKRLFSSSLNVSKKLHHLGFMITLLMISHTTSTFLPLPWAWVIICFWLILLESQVQQVGLTKK